MKFTKKYRVVFRNQKDPMLTLGTEVVASDHADAESQARFLLRKNIANCWRPCIIIVGF
jgi:hypothetical protein